jgi:multiple sugar transport system permease protein
VSVARVDAGVARRARRRTHAGGMSSRGALLLAIPALLPILIFSALPLARGIYLGFTDSQAGLGLPTHFVGLHNFREALSDDQFVESFKIGLIWAFSVTVIQFFLALGLAILLNAPLRGRAVARSLALVPWAMPPVIVGIMWKLVYQQQAGVLNEVLYRTHLPGSSTDWLADFSLALPAAIVVGVWAGMPQTTVALLAGLQTVPDELYEAAAVDGAGAFRRFARITFPQLGGVIVAITTLDFVWNFNSFGLLYVLTEGGPGGKTRVPMLFAYNEAFKYGQFGYAAALGDLMVVVIAAILSVYLWRRFRETA